MERVSPHRGRSLPPFVSVCVFLHSDSEFLPGNILLTGDVEPQPLPLRLHHDDAHHVGDRLRFHDGKREVGFLKRDGVCGGGRDGHPLNVQTSCGGARRAAAVCGFNLREDWNYWQIKMKVVCQRQIRCVFFF